MHDTKLTLTLEKNSLVLSLAFLLWSLIGNAQSQHPSDGLFLELEFSIEGGYYIGEQELQLFSPGATIYYTTNGSKPSKKSKVYKRPLLLRRTTVVRAIAISGKSKSRVLGNTYFIDEPETSIATVSIGISPYLLFDTEKGLFMQGSNAIDSIWTKPGANFWSRKEVTCNVEIFETDGRCVYNSQSGFRLFGGMSRLFPQKSMTLVARKRFGKKRIKHKIFGKGSPKEYKFLVLRNSGSDFGKSHFRDAVMTSLLEEWDLEKQHFRPAQVYINGKYWGLYNIREKVNRYFIADYQDIDKDSIDLLEHRMIRKRGSRWHYRRLVNFLEKADLSDPANYAYVQGQMEIDNFIDYQIAQIYFDNQDAGGNIKFWRPQEKNGRWRWILYDTDWGFGLHNPEAYRNNSLRFHTQANGPKWPNPPWSTLLLRKLLENPDFQQIFANRFADYLNTTFRSERVQEKIDVAYWAVAEEMPRHLKRWRLSESKWQNHINIMRRFAQKRPEYMRKYLEQYFKTGPMQDLHAIAVGGGILMINDNIAIKSETFIGKYFADIPVKIRAVPNFGYRFSHWEGIDADPNLRELTLKLSDGLPTIKAVFEKYDHPLAGKVMINEVCANNKRTGDWVELFNYTKKPVDISGWVFTDTKNEFFFPQNTAIAANDYLVLCQDSSKFLKTFPTAYNVIGGMGFGLNKRIEKLGLFADHAAAVDSVDYDLVPMDTAFTLNLLLPHLDNSDRENWEVVTGSGSPNSPNAYYVESKIRTLQKQWMQTGVAGGVMLICAILLFLRKEGYL